MIKKGRIDVATNKEVISKRIAALNPRRGAMETEGDYRTEILVKRVIAASSSNINDCSTNNGALSVAKKVLKACHNANNLLGNHQMGKMESFMATFIH